MEQFYLHAFLLGGYVSFEDDLVDKDDENFDKNAPWLYENKTIGQKLFIPGATLDSKTLRQAMGETFKIPITAKFRWTSPYGARIDPIKGTKSYHKGTDMACPTGTPVYACGDGKVVLVENRVSTGWSVVIEHLPGLYSLYYHLDSVLIEEGMLVKSGEEIALSGATGLATGPHLHWEVRFFGEAINPDFLVENQLY